MERHPPGDVDAPVRLGKRFVAVFVDGIVVFVLAVVLSLLLTPEFSAGVPASGDIGGFGPVEVVASLLGLGYFVVLEATYGQTLGKAALGVVVKSEDGTDLKAGQAVIRNVLRIVDYLPVFYLLGVILVLVTDENQRLGDVAGSSVVVDRA